MDDEERAEYERPWREATARYLEKQGIEPTDENIREVWKALEDAPRLEIVILE